MMEKHPNRCRNKCKSFIDNEGRYFEGQCLAATAGTAKHGNYYNGSMSSQIMMFIECVGCNSYEMKE